MTNDFVTEEGMEDTGTPVCEKCGSVMIKEENEWVCPQCQGEIDFMGEDEDE